MPLSTPAIQDRTGHGMRHGQLVYQLLTRPPAAGQAGKEVKGAATGEDTSRLESLIAGLREALSAAEARIRELEQQQTPQARQLQLEADFAAADLAAADLALAESGYDRHGRDCQC